MYSHPAGARAVRAVPERSRRRRSRPSTTPPAAPSWSPSRSGRRGGAGVAACGGGLRPRRAAGGRAGLRVQHHPLRHHRRDRPARRQQDDDRLCAAEHAGRPVQGAQRLRAARHQPHQARKPSDARPAVGVPLLRRGGRTARRPRCARALTHLAEFARWTRVLGTYKGAERRRRRSQSRIHERHSVRVCPPSTSTIAPWQNGACGDARNATTRAISSGSPKRAMPSARAISVSALARSIWRSAAKLSRVCSRSVSMLRG